MDIIVHLREKRIPAPSRPTGYGKSRNAPEQALLSVRFYIGLVGLVSTI